MKASEHNFNRRRFLLGCLGGATMYSGWTRIRPLLRPAPEVSIVRAGSYSKDLTSIVRQILRDHHVAVRAKRILLKTNLVEYHPARPIHTNPIFVAAVREAFLSLGAASVRIAEGPGHRRCTLDMAEAAGYFEAIPRFETHFTDLNLDAVVRRPLSRGFSRLHELYLPQTALNCDLLVSLPKMKTHHWAGATLSMKNLFGLVPGAVYGWPKNPLHWAGIHECVAELHYLFPNRFAIVDGIEGMEGNGPILGSSIRSGVIVAGAYPPAVDATCCRIMGIDPEKVGYLQLVSRSSGWDMHRIVQRAEAIKNVRIPFHLIRELEFFRLPEAA
jgi:uncharacterized protein (DUF362 family)